MNGGVWLFNENVTKKTRSIYFKANSLFQVVWIDPQSMPSKTLSTVLYISQSVIIQLKQIHKTLYVIAIPMSKLSISPETVSAVF